MTNVRLSSSSRAASADRAERLGLAHLAVAEEGPDVLLAGVLDAAVVQVAVEPRLVDRVERAEAHRDRRELPEVRHQPRVRVRRQAVARAVRDLLAEAVELVLGQPALEEGAGVDAGGGVALDEDLVAAAGVVLAAEEVVEADLVQAGRRLVGGDVAADLEALAVGARDHHRGVPADEGADPALDVLVAGEPRLALGRDRVDVVGAAQRGDADLLLAGPLEQLEHHVAGALAAALVEQRVERVEPLLGLVGVDVGELGGQTLVDDRRVGAGVGRCCRRSPDHRRTRSERARNPPSRWWPEAGRAPRSRPCRSGLHRRVNSGGLLPTAGAAATSLTGERGVCEFHRGWRVHPAERGRHAARLTGSGFDRRAWSSRSSAGTTTSTTTCAWPSRTPSTPRWSTATTATSSTPCVLWWRDDDGDLVDGLVDSLTDLVEGGAIWLLTPKVGRPGYVEPADIAEAAPIAGLSRPPPLPSAKDWSATKLVAPKTPR